MLVLGKWSGVVLESGLGIIAYRFSAYARWLSPCLSTTQVEALCALLPSCTRFLTLAVRKVLFNRVLASELPTIGIHCTLIYH